MTAKEYKRVRMLLILRYPYSQWISMDKEAKDLAVAQAIFEVLY